MWSCVEGLSPALQIFRNVCDHLRLHLFVTQKAQVTETFEAIFSRCIESIVDGTKRFVSSPQRGLFSPSNIQTSFRIPSLHRLYDFGSGVCARLFLLSFQNSHSSIQMNSKLVCRLQRGQKPQQIQFNLCYILYWHIYLSPLCIFAFIEVDFGRFFKILFFSPK